MRISNKIKETIRLRAGFCCEYCGVSESDCGGELTIDHYQPQSKNGNDELENLVYSCVRCNLYKSDYWSNLEKETLWNPRVDDWEEHFWEAEDGRLLALTEKGNLTINIINLNRSQLIQNRLNKALQNEERRFYKENELKLEVVYGLTEEQNELIKQQQTLLKDQQKLLRLFLNKN